METMRIFPIVRYTHDDSKGQPHPAFITHMHADGTANLAVFNDPNFAIVPGRRGYMRETNGLPPVVQMTRIPRSDEDKQGHWTPYWTDCS